LVAWGEGRLRIEQATPLSKCAKINVACSSAAGRQTWRMNDWTRRLLWVVLAGSSPAPAQTVHRCIDADGQRVFTDRRCDDLGLQREQSADAPSTTVPGEPVALEIETGPVAAAAGCPGPTPEALRDNLMAAISARDLNGLTGMYHWGGAGRVSASSVIELMTALIDAAPQAAELRAVEQNDDWLWAGLPPPTEAAPPELVVLGDALAFDPIARFQLRPQAGCLWLSLR